MCIFTNGQTEREEERRKYVTESERGIFIGIVKSGYPVSLHCDLMSWRAFVPWPGPESENSPSVCFS